ncbi:MAG: hypothetical protein MJ170_04355, partial [Alphaproteobacteria bacterium]|nr:hypothetical protein [Alphaproteobacteria bacterium]
LYGETGEATDGTMTQGAITTELEELKNSISGVLPVEGAESGKVLKIDESGEMVWGKDLQGTTYTAGDGISIDNNTISLTGDIPAAANDAKLTLQSNGITIGTFSANASIDETINITDNDTTYETGTATTSGLTKLYGETGEATDGTMTQGAIKTELEKLQNSMSTSKVRDANGENLYDMWVDTGN